MDRVRFVAAVWCCASIQDENKLQPLATESRNKGVERGQYPPADALPGVPLLIAPCGRNLTPFNHCKCEFDPRKSCVGSSSKPTFLSDHSRGAVSRHDLVKKHLSDFRTSPHDDRAVSKFQIFKAFYLPYRPLCARCPQPNWLESMAKIVELLGRLYIRSWEVAALSRRAQDGVDHDRRELIVPGCRREAVGSAAVGNGVVLAARDSRVQGIFRRRLAGRSTAPRDPSPRQAMRTAG